MRNVWMALIGFASAAVYGILAYLESGEPFNVRKFSHSILAGIGVGIGTGLLAEEAGAVTGRDILAAVAYGMGGDAVRDRTIGAFKTLISRSWGGAPNVPS